MRLLQEWRSSLPNRTTSQCHSYCLSLLLSDICCIQKCFYGLDYFFLFLKELLVIESVFSEQFINTPGHFI